MGPTLLALALAAAADQPPTSGTAVRASAAAMVRIVKAATLRGGEVDEPHRRRIISDETGARKILIEFE